MTHPLAAVAALACAAALVLGAVAGSVVLLVAVLLVQGLLIAGWHRMLGVPGGGGGIVVAGAAAIGADVYVVMADDLSRPLADVPAVLALAFLAALVHQMVRRDGRTRLTASLSATVSLAALAALAACVLAAAEGDKGGSVVVVAAATAGLAMAAGVARRSFGLPFWAEPVGGLAAAAVTSAVVVWLSDLGAGPAAAIASGAAAAAWVSALLVARAPAPDPLLAAALPQAVAGSIAYVLARLLVG